MEGALDRGGVRVSGRADACPAPFRACERDLEEDRFGRLPTPKAERLGPDCDCWGGRCTSCAANLAAGNSGLCKARRGEELLPCWGAAGGGPLEAGCTLWALSLSTPAAWRLSKSFFMASMTAGGVPLSCAAANLLSTAPAKF